MKINFEATFREVKHKSRFEIVIRDNSGQILGSKVVINNNVPSSFVVEAIACVQSLQRGHELGLVDIILEGDSLSVIQKIRSECADKSLISTYIRDCREIGQGFNTCSFNHTPRSANDVVHVLAIEGLKAREKWCMLGGDRPRTYSRSM